MGMFVKVDDFKDASVLNVFACGDAARAAGNVTLAVADGAMAHCLQQGWLRRHEGELALEVTPLGRKYLAGLLPSVNAL